MDIIKDSISGLVRKGRPTQGDVHVNAPLTNMSVAYMQDETSFVAESVFPTIPVEKQSNLYYVYAREDFNRDSMKRRADSTESQGDGWTLSTDSYFAHVWALHKDVGDQIVANADDVVNLDMATTKFLTLKALLWKEINFADNFFTTNVWNTDKEFGSGSDQSTPWSDDASTPIEDVEEAKNVMLEATGFEPNTLTIGKRVWSALKNHPDVIDRLKYGQTPGGPAKVTMAAIAALFEIDRILVMKSIQNTAKQGATESNSFIGGNHGLLNYVTPTPGHFIPSAGYTFGWTGYTGASKMGSRISKWYNQDRRSDRHEIEIAFDQKAVASDLGYFMENLAITPTAATS